MNTKQLTWPIIALLAVAIAGCLPSLNPVYRPENLVFDPSVIGVWKQPKSTETWKFTKRDDKSYSLVYTDERGQQGRFIACLADIGGKRFLDLFPDEGELKGTGFYKFHLVPIHTIYLVQRTEPTLQLAALNYPWLDDYLADNPSAIEHATFGGRTLITASTEQVQAFALIHQHAFTTSLELERASNGEIAKQ
jgi:hypothetical protein